MKKIVEYGTLMYKFVFNISDLAVESVELNQEELRNVEQARFIA
jgi:hypothetical protein